MKIKRRWKILMAAMALIAVAGLTGIFINELAEYEEHIKEKNQTVS